MEKKSSIRRKPFTITCKAEYEINTIVKEKI
jgi:hypothetical protein